MFRAYTKQQTFPDPVGTSHLCQSETSRLTQFLSGSTIILYAIAESRLDGVAMFHFEGRHARPPQTSAGGADGSVGGAVQVEAVEQVVGVGVAFPQGRQAVTGLDHLQDRGGVVERVIHEAAPGERRDDQGRHA